jgi:SAM-dependent methyltransferase
MGSVSHSFLRMFRGAPEAAAAAAPHRVEERASRRSSGLNEFTRAIAGEEGLRVLDLGPTSPANIALLTDLGHKVYNEDVLKASQDPALVLPAGEDGKSLLDADRFLAENLVYDSGLFDAILCWDAPDYLHESLVKPMVNRIHRIMKPKGILLAFFHTRDAGPDAPYYRYHIVGKDTLELQTGPRFRVQRIFNNRHVENLFRDFGSIKFFLARDNVREVLVVR